MVPRTHVTGKVILPNGLGAPGGTITCALSMHGTVLDPDTGQEEVIAGAGVAPIGADGSVDLLLVPNSKISPAGAYYLVTIAVPGQEPVCETVTVPEHDASLADLLPAIAGGPVVAVVDAERIRGIAVVATGPVDGQVLQYVAANDRIEWRTPSGSAGGAMRVGELAGGAPNGANAIFTTAAPYAPNTLAVYRNGQRLARGADYSESSDRRSFVLIEPPAEGETLLVDYQLG